VLTAVSHLPPQTATDAESIATLAREKVVIRRRLAALYDTDAAIRAAIDAAVASFAGRLGDADSWDRLATLLERQAYRLSFWRVATEEINYRRFFDVNSLAALRMERPEVFEATHGLLLLLVAAHAVDGLRIDHPDGLRDPEQYLRRLQARAGEVLAGRALPSAERLEPVVTEPLADEDHDLTARMAAVSANEHPLYVVVEKILGHGERLPPSWPVDGATGYEYLNSLNGIFIDMANRKAFDLLYRSVSGHKTVFRDLLYETKKQVMRSVLASEVNVLGQQLSRVAARHRTFRDFTPNALTTALIEVIACFPIYRTYIRPGEGGVSERDRLYVQVAVERAQRRNPTADQSIYGFIESALTFEGFSTEHGGPLEDQIDFVLKFQQVSSPAMAKSLEDTTFYSYTRLVSLNEVGGDPDQFGVSPAAFHRANAERTSRWRGSLLALSTHDTKRSEDVRARLNVLSELPRDWRAAVRRWSALNRRFRRAVRARERYPDRDIEYLFYQTLVGAWPLELLDAPKSRYDASQHRDFASRIHDYMEKAAREAKVYTSWISQNIQYEEALLAFVDGALARPQSNPFIQEALPFIRRIAEYGLTNSLAQTLIKLTSPGVPDTYQGTELWDFSLVDPDNRRPVDYASRVAALDELRARLAAGEAAALAAELLAARHDGRIKLLITHCALAMRAAHPALYDASGSYQPLDATGAHAESVIAFQRAAAGETAITVAPRLLTRLSAEGAPPLGDVWGDTALLLRDPPGTRYRDAFTALEFAAEERNGAVVLPLADLFRTLPVALLSRLPA
jgi:(1->4)-alpha-D-glucan 1-alpha-D-glucosylmutase